jgi:hypothetical protein
VSVLIEWRYNPGLKDSESASGNWLSTTCLYLPKSTCCGSCGIMEAFIVKTYHRYYSLVELRHLRKAQLVKKNSAVTLVGPLVPIRPEKM